MAPAPLFTLRPATERDYAWLWEIKRTTMRPYVELTWGNWDDEAQERFFRQHFVPGAIEVITVEGKHAGLLNLEREPGEIFLANIQLHPDFQNQGLGAAVVNSVLASARALGLPVRLQVLKVNTRARDFYARLGFRVYGENLTHLLMRAMPRAVREAATG